MWWGLELGWASWWVGMNMRNVDCTWTPTGSLYWRTCIPHSLDVNRILVVSINPAEYCYSLGFAWCDGSGKGGENCRWTRVWRSTRFRVASSFLHVPLLLGIVTAFSSLSCFQQSLRIALVSEVLYGYIENKLVFGCQNVRQQGSDCGRLEGA